MAEGPTKGVSGAETIDHVDRKGLDLDSLAHGFRHDSFGALLHYRNLHPTLEERVGGSVGFSLTDGNLALFRVPNRNGRTRQRLFNLGRGLGRDSTVQLDNPNRGWCGLVDPALRGRGGALRRRAP